MPLKQFYGGERTTEHSHVQNLEEFLRVARDRYTFALEVDREDRAEAEDDNKFANASDKSKDQWVPEFKKAREDSGRPVMQWNRIPTYVQQVVNDGRQSKPSIRISAADGGKPETANFLQSRIRHVEYECNADTARDTVRDQQVTSGRGSIRISTEWVPGKFEQRICMEAIENQFSVVWDPAAQLYDRSDAEYCFVIDLISKEAHERDYGKKSVVSTIDFASESNPAPEWIGAKGGKLIQVAQYWCKEYKKRKLCKLSGTDRTSTYETAWEDELTPEQTKRVLMTREDQDVTIWCYIINGAEILKESEWIGSSIPIVPLWGRQATVDGKRRTYSLIRNSKDPQRSVNFYVSNIAEQVAMMPKTPYIAAIGSIPGNVEITYEEVSGVPVAFLLYKEYDSDGRRLSKPERVIAEPPIQALTIGLQQAIDGIKASMGIFDALGARPNQASGVAIQRANKQSDNTNFHFADNEARTRKREGEIILEILRKIDQSGTSKPTRGEDGKTKLVKIGEPFLDEKTGKEVIHNLTEGDYGVTISSGPSYTAARQEENDRIAQLIQAEPGLIWVIGAQLFATADTPGSQEMAELMTRAINMKAPGLIQEPGQQQPVPPEIQAQVQQMQKQLQDTQAFAQSLHEQLETKQPELDMKWKIAQLQEETKRTIGLAAIDATDAITKFQEELGILHKKVDQAHELTLKGVDQQHEADMQRSSQVHASGESDADRQAAAEQQEAAGQEQENE